MALEVERKFLVSDDGWRRAVLDSRRMRQGYLSAGGAASVRVRISGETANLNVKAAVVGTSRLEFEYPIPCADAETLLDQLCAFPPLEKIRHRVPHGDHVWEVDEFTGANAGLVVAEIELARADEPFARPVWLGREVTEERRYYNQALAEHPWCEWGHAD